MPDLDRRQTLALAAAALAAAVLPGLGLAPARAQATPAAQANGADRPPMI